MPKKVQKISHFHKGIINAIDKKDIPDEGVVNSSDLMFDIQGQARQMGSESVHAELNGGGVLGNIESGYGLFAFNSDYNVSDNAEVASKLLAVQQDSKIAVIDQTLSANTITVNDAEIDLKEAVGADISEKPAPIFIYVDGQLKICDAKFSNSSYNFPKTYSYLRKTWFYQTDSKIGSPNESTAGYYNAAPAITNTTGGTHASQGEWTAKRSFIFPPSVSASANANTHQLYTDSGVAHSWSNDPNSGMDIGNISLQVNSTDDPALVDTGEWASGLYYFGISFQYDSGQESQVTTFNSPWDGTSVMLDNTPLAFKLKVKLGNASANVVMGTEFDSRLSGINLYWTGDGDSTFSDPLWVGYWHWGNNSSDLSYFESHAGDRVEGTDITHAGAVFSTDGADWTDATATDANSGLIVNTIPALTFEIRNLYNNETDSISARYKSIVIINRRAYIGGVQRFKFDLGTPDIDSNSSKGCSVVPQPQNLDRMIKSPVGQFDVFPKENFIDVAINDGESITHLMGFNDRILQFKENTLYILNISGDLEYLESTHKYMGISHQYQAIETENGIVWVNPNGCFLYTEGPPINLAEVLMFGASDNQAQLGSFSSWSDFIGNTGMVGYLPVLKQLVVFQDPSTTGTGDVLIFDMRTKSWAFGTDKCSAENKSNVVMNYNNACLYLSQTELMSSFSSWKSRAHSAGQDAVWTITNIVGPDPTAENLKYIINGEEINEGIYTSDLNVGLTDNSLQDVIISKINSKMDTNSSRQSFIAVRDNDYVRVSRPDRLIGLDSSTVYNGYDMSSTGTMTVANFIKIDTYATAPITEAVNGFFEPYYVNLGAFYIPGSANTPYPGLSNAGHFLPHFSSNFNTTYGVLDAESMCHHVLLFQHASLGRTHGGINFDDGMTYGLNLTPPTYTLRTGSVLTDDANDESYSHINFSLKDKVIYQPDGILIGGQLATTVLIDNPIESGDEVIITNALSSGSHYKISWTVNNNPLGAFRIKGAGADESNSNGDAIYTHDASGSIYITATANTALSIEAGPGSDFNGTISDIYIKAVNTADSIKWRLGHGFDDQDNYIEGESNSKDVFLSLATGNASYVQSTKTQDVPLTLTQDYARYLLSTDGWPSIAQPTIATNHDSRLTHHSYSNPPVNLFNTFQEPIYPEGSGFSMTGPSITFRNYQVTPGVDSPDDTIVLSMMGNYADTFIQGNIYTIDNAFFSSYSITDTGDTLNECYLSNINHRHLVYDEMEVADNLASAPGDGWDITLLYFRRGDQQSNASSNNTLSARFNYVKSYGSRSTVTITHEHWPNEESSNYIDNNLNTGSLPSPAIWTINPRYNGLTTESIASITMINHGGYTYNITQQISANAPIIEVSELIESRIANTNMLMNGLYGWESLSLHEYPDSQVWYIGWDDSDAGNGESFYGCRIRVELDLAKYGVARGDAINFVSTNMTYIVKTMYPYGKDYAGGADLGYTTFDIDSTLTQNATTGNIAAGGLAGTFTAAHPSVAHSATVVKFSNLIMTGDANSAYPHSISMSLAQIGDVNVNQFINDPGFASFYDIWSKNISLETKTFDFGSPGVLKAFYYIDITFKAAVENDLAEDFEPILSFYCLGRDTTDRLSLYTRLDEKTPAEENSMAAPDTGLCNTNGIYISRRYYFSMDKKPVKDYSLSILIEPIDNSPNIQGFSINDMNITFREFKI